MLFQISQKTADHTLSDEVERANAIMSAQSVSSSAAEKVVGVISWYYTEKPDLLKTWVVLAEVQGEAVRVWSAPIPAGRKGRFPVTGWTKDSVEQG